MTETAAPYGEYLGEDENEEFPHVQFDHIRWAMQPDGTALRIAALEEKVERLERAVEILATVGGDKTRALSYLREEYS